ncbi:MAG: hypothetical protein N3D11_17640 [Candidatus Sumerlaeia bacterium]|nr:hypothetical protein [Candidatus Sumerlaeia bacterium]
MAKPFREDKDMLALQAREAGSVPHRSLLGLGGVLKGFSMPDGPFDPRGEWEHRYRVFIVRTTPEDGWQCLPGGALILRRKPLDGGRFELTVRFGAEHGTTIVDRLDAQMVCKTDETASLVSWQLRAVLFDTKQGKAAIEAVVETGSIAGGEIRLAAGAKKKTLRAPEPITSNWSLFEALQRLGPERTAPPEFSMLEELRLLRLNQRLVAKPPVEVGVGGRAVLLRRLEHFGDGILPYTYWFDGAGRLLFAVGGLRAYVWEPKVELDTK